MLRGVRYVEMNTICSDGYIMLRWIHYGQRGTLCSEVYIMLGRYIMFGGAHYVKGYIILRGTLRWDTLCHRVHCVTGYLTLRDMLRLRGTLWLGCIMTYLDKVQQHTPPQRYCLHYTVLRQRPWGADCRIVGRRWVCRYHRWRNMSPAEAKCRTVGCTRAQPNLLRANKVR